MPGDRESDWRCAEDAKIVSVVGILPDILTVYHKEFSERLLQASMELIAIACGQIAGGGTDQAGIWVSATFPRQCEKIGNDCVLASYAESTRFSLKGLSRVLA